MMKRRYPSYHKPYEVARTWLREGGPLKAEALELLTWLRQKYPHVLAVGNELVLALLENDRRDKALAELSRLKAEFPEVDEETRCRWGRLYKQEGDRAWQAGDLVRAESRCQEALEQYDLGYGVRQGHYPGINKAALLVLLAALARQRGDSVRSEEYLRQAEATAAEVLANRDKWPKDFTDDNIWHAATAGEAYLLERKWADAAAQYRAALSEANVQPFHRQSIGKQARRLLDAWKRLDVQPDKAFDADALFGPPPG
jgi:tetratricopeptide (TPR) repeat protein